MITLMRATMQDAERIWRMQREAFAGLVAKYQDFDTNPGSEPLSKVGQRLAQPETFFYLIEAAGEQVGAIRVVDRQDGGRKRISPLFILPEHQGCGYAQQAMQAAEALHGTADWALSTIAQEAGNCYLYEKLGYRRTGQAQVINERMTLVFYEK